MRALLERARDDTRNFRSTEHQHLLCTLLDELKETPATGTFLPASDGPLLGPILHHLEQHPQDNRSVTELARGAGTTERTLARKCRQDLNIPLSEWRNRMRIVKAMALLETGRTIESIAKEFRYSSASAFIAMFRKLTSTTPARYRATSR